MHSLKSDDEILEINSTSRYFYYLKVEVQLIAPEILATDEKVGITVTVNLFNFLKNYTLIGITDGISSKGLHIQVLDNIMPHSKLNEIKMQFKPAKNWA